MNRGKYIVLEGPEGVGKTTQILELARRLQAAGLPVRTLREPDSQSDLTARALRQLTQDPRYPMNTNTEILLYNAARSQSLQVIKRSVEQGVICIVDRNYLTTLAIQYYGRGDVPDYNAINKIISFAVNGVEPDLCIVMDAPVQTLKERAKFRGQGERFDNLDEAFLERVRAGYLWEAKQRNLPVVFATEDEQAVTESIWKLVTETLAIRGGSKALSASEPTSLKQIIAEKQQPALPHEPPLDSTAQTAVVPSASAAVSTSDTVHVTLENTSGLLLELLKSTQLVQVKRQSGNQQYFVPASLTGETRELYQQKLTALTNLRKSLVESLTKHLQIQSTKNSRHQKLEARAEAICRAVVPLAQASLLTLDMPARVMPPLLQKLQASELPEAKTAALDILAKARKTQPETFTDIEVPVESENSGQQLTTLASTYLSETYPTDVDREVILTNVWPKSELSLVGDMLYAESNLPLDALEVEVESWSYDKKAEVFEAYLAANNHQSALRRVHYCWDLISSYSTFSDLLNSQATQTLERQMLTPRYGYSTPSIIEEANLSDQFEACFSLSLELYSLLQEAGHPREAQYAVLHGHKLRYQLTHTAQDAFQLCQIKNSRATRKLVTNMRDKITEVHPLLANALDLDK